MRSSKMDSRVGGAGWLFVWVGAGSAEGGGLVVGELGSGDEALGGVVVGVGVVGVAVGGEVAGADCDSVMRR
jgi:hypothetical protein